MTRILLDAAMPKRVYSYHSPKWVGNGFAIQARVGRESATRKCAEAMYARRNSSDSKLISCSDWLKETFQKQRRKEEYFRKAKASDTSQEKPTETPSTLLRQPFPPKPR